jgi:hypothetical protein
MHGSAVGRDLGRDHVRAERSGEEAPRCGQVAPCGQLDVDDLAILIDGPVEIGHLPATSHKSRRRITGRRERSGTAGRPR